MIITCLNKLLELVQIWFLFLKVEIAQRKGDYAERVKARNRILLAEQKRNEDAESKANSQSEPSKLQRVFI